MAPLIACTDDDEVNVNFEANASFIAAANPAVISELLDRLEAAESECLEQARLNGMGSEREAALMAKLEAAEKERDFAKTEIARLHDDIRELTDVRVLDEEDRDRIVAWRQGTSAQPAPSFADAYQGAMEEVAIWKKRALEAEELNRKFIAEINGPTYMGEPAQPAPSVPDGYKLVPIVSTDEMDNAGADHCDGYLSTAQVVWDAMIAAAPVTSVSSTVR